MKAVEERSLRLGHLMELPHAVYVGNCIISELSTLLISQALEGPICIASGPNVKRLLGRKLTDGLNDYQLSWVEIASPTLGSVKSVKEEAIAIKARTVIGFGGGKSIDVAKVAAYELKIPMVSVPTSASHDGISSPFASLRDSRKPYSRATKPPYVIAADLELIKKAPERLFKGGFGDLVAKITAVRDWELARDEKGEYFGDYAANLAKMSAQHVMERAEDIHEMNQEGVRALIEALISSGVAAGIAGSSRPCSGSEHLISHALEVIAPGAGLHGEKTGLGTVIIAALYGMDWSAILSALRDAGCPTSFRDLGISEEQLVQAVLMAPEIRPDRYTILHKKKLSKDDITKLVRKVGVV